MAGKNRKQFRTYRRSRGILPRSRGRASGASRPRHRPAGHRCRSRRRGGLQRPAPPKPTIIRWSDAPMSRLADKSFVSPGPPHPACSVTKSPSKYRWCAQGTVRSACCPACTCNAHACVCVYVSTHHLLCPCVCVVLPLHVCSLLTLPLASAKPGSCLIPSHRRRGRQHCDQVVLTSTASQ